ncbi:MAG: tRNA (guanosine(46)-N7)-methyltransferase TrmB [Succinivibrio sp.]|nr:tRNA (guanosine(46)-N7)-methyltransferase TrmB [Succinivibrio sp.]
MTEQAQEHRIKSYVIRQGRITDSQLAALETLGPKYLLELGAEPFDLEALFPHSAPVVLEIGFGMGKSFIEMALNNPESNFLGIEVHPPGVGACLKLIESHQLTNVKLIRCDAIEVLKQGIMPESLQVVQVFFPDPWPKKRHHKRRLINPEFISLIYPLLKQGGHVRLATDWEEYAQQMLEVMSQAQGFANTAADGGFIPRPDWRPLTKFETRGTTLGHGIWDLDFVKQ